MLPHRAFHQQWSRTVTVTRACTRFTWDSHAPHKTSTSSTVTPYQFWIRCFANYQFLFGCLVVSFHKITISWEEGFYPNSLKSYSRHKKFLLHKKVKQKGMTFWWRITTISNQMPSYIYSNQYRHFETQSELAWATCVHINERTCDKDNERICVG